MTLRPAKCFPRLILSAGWGCRDQAGFVCDDELGAVAGMEFGEQSADMGFDGREAEGQVLGDVSHSWADTVATRHAPFGAGRPDAVRARRTIQRISVPPFRSNVAPVMNAAASLL